MARSRCWWGRGRPGRPRRGATLTLVAWLVLAGLAHDRADAQTSRGGMGVHAVAGVFGGRYAQEGNPDSDLAGARLGVGIGELLQINGFYWRSVDVDEREFTAHSAWGAESRLALNAGFGVAPFLTGGLGRIEREATDAETAAIAGAGLMIPLGPILIEAAVQDYILGISALNDSDDATEASHNWLYSAGITVAIGPRRRRAAVPVPPPASPPAAEQVAVGAGTAPDPVAPIPDDDQRNYQSEQSIQIPLPLEGSILLRYGPEREPMVVAGSGRAESSVAGARSEADLELMLRRIVADEVTSRLATSPMILAPGAGEGAGGAALSEARVQQIVDRTVAALLPRLEASQAQQMNALRAELTTALNQQTAALRSGVAAPQSQPPLVYAQPTQPPPAATPPATAPGDVVQPPATDPVGPPAPEVPAVAPLSPTREMRLVELRSRFAELASQHPGLGVVETDRGPGLSVPGEIFAADQALPGPGASDLVGPIARLTREVADVLVFVQGHASPGGSEVSAQTLSELRAEAIRSLLVQAGMEPGRVHAIGYGAARPLSAGTGAEARAIDRRVEIVFVPRPIS